MSNTQIIAELGNARQAFLRESIAIMVRNHGPDDIVSTLADVLHDYAHNYARRSGDYDGAGKMGLVAEFLDGLDKFVDNYDPTVE